MKTTVVRVVALFLLVVSPLAAQGKRAFTPEDWYKIARVGGGTLSPDGNTLAFTVTTVIEEKNARHTEVWIQSLAGGPSKRMTSPAFESTAPRWSDDGKTLYFTSTRPGSRGNTWGIKMDEGGEAFPAEGAAGGGAGGRGGRGGGGRGGPTVTVAQDAKTLTITRTMGENTVNTVYNLDGSESTNQTQSPEGPLTVKGTAKWEGANLVIETTREIQGMAITTREVRTLDATGKEMTIEATTRAPQGDITRKIVFTKGG